MLFGSRTCKYKKNIFFVWINYDYDEGIYVYYNQHRRKANRARLFLNRGNYVIALIVSVWDGLFLRISFGFFFFSLFLHYNIHLLLWYKCALHCQQCVSSKMWIKSKSDRALIIETLFFLFNFFHFIQILNFKSGSRR